MLGVEHQLTEWLAMLGRVHQLRVARHARWSARWTNRQYPADGFAEEQIEESPVHSIPVFLDRWQGKITGKRCENNR